MRSTNPPLRIFVAMPATNMGSGASYKSPESVKRNLLIPMKKELEKRTGYKVDLVIEKEKAQAGVIHTSMFGEALRADVFIADLTGGNPNVYLELGVRWALRDHITIPIVQNIGDLRFNVITNRAIAYSPDIILDAIEQIVTAIVDGLKQRNCDSPVRLGADLITVSRSEFETLRASRSSVPFVAAICCAMSDAGDVLFLLVQTTRQRWIFPKGRVQIGEDAADAARRCAYDEGGVSGTIIRSDELSFRHLKEDEHAEQLFQTFMIHVTGKTVPAAHFRSPQWVTRSEAEILVAEGRSSKYAQELQKVLQIVEERYLTFRSTSQFGEIFVKQAAVVPYRRRPSKIEILLITSLDTKRWLFPQGNIEDSETAKEAALREAYVKAGIQGSVSDHVVGVYDSENLGRMYTVQAFVMQVTSEADEWPERKLRRRKWFEPETAASLVQEEYLKQMIVDFNRVSKP
jgi:8-oxo-dGTP pyrophosphatase MutT (NUDIX family)